MPNFYYIGWGLEVDYWLDTVPLHFASSEMLVGAPVNVWLKQYNNICPHQALNIKLPGLEILLKFITRIVARTP